MGRLTALVAALALASPGAFLQSHQGSDGGFAEPGGREFPELTAWATLALRADGRNTDAALAYLRAHEDELTQPNQIALVALAEAAAGGDSAALLRRLPAQPTRVNTAIWGILAYRQAGKAAPPAYVTYLRRSQARNGGFSWQRGGKPDSNDSAAAVQALRAIGMKGKPIARALTFLRKFQNRDGGFELALGRGSDAQSTAFAVQAFVAGGGRPPAHALAYLASLRRADGSYRYSRAYAVTPVWVTSQVLPAARRKPFPLR